MSTTWFVALRPDGSECGLGCHCTTCGVTMHMVEKPIAWQHCGHMDAYVAPASWLDRMLTPALPRRVAYKPSSRPITVLEAGWDGVTDYDPTAGMIGGPAFD